MSKVNPRGLSKKEKRDKDLYGKIPNAKERLEKGHAARVKGAKDSSVVGGKIKVKAQPIFLKSGGKGKAC